MSGRPPRASPPPPPLTPTQRTRRPRDHGVLDRDSMDTEPSVAALGGTPPFPRLKMLCANAVLDMGLPWIEDKLPEDVVETLRLLDTRFASLTLNAAKVAIWRLRDNKRVCTLVGHSGRVQSFAAMPDGRLFCTGSEDRTVRVWDLRSGRCLHVLRGHTDSVGCLTVIRYHHVLSGGSDGNLRLWNVRSGVLVRVFSLPKPETKVRCVASLPRTRAISGGTDKALRVWSLRLGKQRQVLTGHRGTVQAVAVVPGGWRCVSCASDQEARLWNIEAVHCLARISLESTALDVVSIGSNMVALGGLAGSIVIWPFDDSPDHTTELTRRTGRVVRLCRLPDGRLASTGVPSPTLQVWNLVTGVCEHALGMFDAGAMTIVPAPQTQDLIDKQSADYDRGIEYEEIAYDLPPSRRCCVVM